MILKVALMQDTCVSTPTLELIIDYYWAKMLKIAVTTIPAHMCPCMCVICYSRTQIDLYKVTFTNMK